MKVDVKQVLKDLKGEPIKLQGSDDNMTLGDVIELAIVQGGKEPKAPEEALKLYKLSKLVHDADGVVELQSDDIVRLKKLIPGCWASPLVAGQAIEMVEAGVTED